MNKKSSRIISLITLVTLFSMSCNLLNMAFTKSAEESGGTNVKETPRAGEEISATKGKDYVYEEGGFQFTPIEDWEVACIVGIIQMAAPNSSPEFGPAFMIMAGENPNEMTNEEAFEKFKEQSSAAKIGKPEKVKIDGRSGLQSELTSTQGDTEIHAIVMTAMLTPTYQFTLMAMSPEDQWKRELNPYFKDVVKSIQFFDPVPGAGCPGAVSVPEPSEVPAADEPSFDSSEVELIRQWAIFALASSEYSMDSWSAMQAIGEPNVNECTDSSDAWASEGANTEEWIELTYAIPVIPTGINIHMNYNPSQITEVQIIDINNDFYTVIETSPEYIEDCPDIYQISIDLDEDVYVTGVRILLDQSVLGLGWTEVDAVELVGYPVAGSAVDSTAPQNNSSSNSSYSSPPYQPDELDPGTFSYSVSGYENEMVMSTDFQYQSTENSYVIGLISGTERYIVSLFIPRQGLKSGNMVMEPYDQTRADKGLTAAIYINAFLYLALDGEYNFAVDPATGTLTGTYAFQAQSKDFLDRFVEISGAINEVPLK